MNEQIKHYEDKLKYEIDSWDLSIALKEGQNVVVIDARSNDAYDYERIPTSINLPHKTMDKLSTKDLDHEALYVIYCDGIGCNASTKGALNMAKLGFNVKELMGGLDWWIRDGHATEGKNAREASGVSCSC